MSSTVGSRKRKPSAEEGHSDLGGAVAGAGGMGPELPKRSRIDVVVPEKKGPQSAWKEKWIDPDNVIGWDQKLHDPYRCVICYMIPFDPQEIACSKGCGAVCCEADAKQWFSIANKGCPKCNSAVDQRRFAATRSLALVLAQLEVKCPQCETKTTLGRSGNPYFLIPWVPIPPTRAHPLSGSTLREHLEWWCPKVDVKCEFIGCLRLVPRSQFEAHSATCDYRLVECVSCAEKIPVNDMSSHLKPVVGCANCCLCPNKCLVSHLLKTYV